MHGHTEPQLPVLCTTRRRKKGRPLSSSSTFFFRCINILFIGSQTCSADRRIQKFTSVAFQLDIVCLAPDISHAKSPLRFAIFCLSEPLTKSKSHHCNCVVFSMLSFYFDCSNSVVSLRQSWFRERHLSCCLPVIIDSLLSTNPSILLSRL
jgi:hypothetical protein